MVARLLPWLLHLLLLHGNSDSGLEKGELLSESQYMLGSVWASEDQCVLVNDTKVVLNRLVWFWGGGVLIC